MARAAVSLMGAFTVGGAFSRTRYVLPRGFRFGVFGARVYEPSVSVGECVQAFAARTLGDSLRGFVEIDVTTEHAPPQELLLEDPVPPSNRDLGVGPDDNRESAQDGPVEGKRLGERDFDHGPSWVSITMKTPRWLSVSPSGNASNR